MKHELRQMCVMKNLPASGKISELVNRLLENDAVNKQIEADQNKLTPAQICESCDDNVDKLHATPIAKWYCRECDQKICNLCKDAHLKIKMIRSHIICPFGTNLEFNIDRNESIVINFPQSFTPKPTQKKRFMDITIDTPNGSMKKKRRVEEIVETVEEDSFEIIYKTPMARMKMNKKTNSVQVDYFNLIPETPVPVSSSSIISSSLLAEVSIIPETPITDDVPSRCIFTDDSTIIPETPVDGYSNLSPCKNVTTEVTIIPETPIVVNASATARFLFTEDTLVPETPMSSYVISPGENTNQYPSDEIVAQISIILLQPLLPTLMNL